MLSPQKLEIGHSPRNSKPATGHQILTALGSYEANPALAEQVPACYFGRWMLIDVEEFQNIDKCLLNPSEHFGTNPIFVNLLRW